MLPRVSRSSALENPAQATAVLRDAGFSPWLARALAVRGVDDPTVAQGKYSLLHYRHLKGIDQITQIICQAIQDKQRLTVVADYDCDGATACAIAVSGLRALGATIDFIVPNRFKHGYGLTPSVVDVVAEAFPDTRYIITVDNGIASIAGVQAANDRGIGVLVTDHHLPGPDLPDADAIVNPNQPGCEFESKNLAGCGVMYYVLAAVRTQLSSLGLVSPTTPPLSQWLDLVALGTVADVVKLDQNNRWLVNQGLQRIRAGHMRPGIAALFAVAGRDPARANASDFGFALGPRLNAAGRLDDMSIGIRCLLATDDATAHELAMTLDELNVQRKEIEGTMRDAAWQDIDLSGQAGKFTRVVYDPSFHEGVIGIVAGRIKEQDFVPTVVFAGAQEEGLIKGSGRSIPGLHLRDVLDLVHKRGNDMFHKFGGHAMAAGLTLPLDRLDDFRELFEQAVQEVLEGKLPAKQLEVDGDLPDIALGDIDIIDQMARHVWGQGFEEPVWTGTFEVVEARVTGKDKNHLSMLVERDGNRYKAVHFFDAQNPPQPGEHVALAYRPSINEFRGNWSVDLMVVDRG